MLRNLSSKDFLFRNAEAYVADNNFNSVGRKTFGQQSKQCLFLFLF